jgi:hypothetical protein
MFPPVCVIEVCSDSKSRRQHPHLDRNQNDESAARHAIARSASNFEGADQQQPTVTPRWQHRRAVVRLESLVESYDVPIEIMIVQNLIRSRVKRMRGAPRQVMHRDPHRRLIGLPPCLLIVIGDSLVPGSIVSNPIQCRADTGSLLRHTSGLS